MLDVSVRIVKYDFSFGLSNWNGGVGVSCCIRLGWLGVAWVGVGEFYFGIWDNFYLSRDVY